MARNSGKAEVNKATPRCRLCRRSVKLGEFVRLGGVDPAHRACAEAKGLAFTEGQQIQKTAAEDGPVLEMSLPGGGGALVGYARVSTPEQDISMQIDALKKAGCRQIFQDVASGAKTARPGLAQALSYLRPTDTLVVWKLDRLGRSLGHLVEVVEGLRRRGVGFRSLTNTEMDTTTSGGRLIFAVFAGLAEMERDLIRERTKAGLEAAKARGRKGGRRPVVSPALLRRAKELMRERRMTVRETASALKIGKTALYEALQADKEAQNNGTA